MKRFLCFLMIIAVLTMLSAPVLALAAGDVNCDGTISAYDASLVLRHITGIETMDSSDSLVASDANMDGTVDAADASYILRYCVGLHDGLDFTQTTAEIPSETPNTTDAPKPTPFVTAVPSSVPTPEPSSEKELTFVVIDVGFGECLLLVSPSGNSLLIDSSANGINDHGVTAERQIKNTLAQYGIADIDLAMYSHAHGDHIYGFMDFIFDTYEIDAFAYPDCRVNSTATNYQKIHTAMDLQPFDQYAVSTVKNTEVFDAWDSDVEIDVLWPIPNYSTSDWNNTCLVLKVTYADTSILLTGDISSTVESKLIEIYEGTDMLDCDILKIAHHTSNGSSSKNWIKATSPVYAVASTTQTMSYNWPGVKTIGRFNDAGHYWWSEKNTKGTLFATLYHGNCTYVIDSDGEIEVMMEHRYAG